MPNAMLMPNTDIAVVFMLNGRMDVPSQKVAAIARARRSQTLSGIRFGESKAQTIIQNKPARVNKTRFAPAFGHPEGEEPGGRGSWSPRGSFASAEKSSRLHVLKAICRNGGLESI